MRERNYFNMGQIIRNKDKATDCIVCLLYPILKVGCVCGIPAFIMKCPHSKQSYSSAKFIKSRNLLLLSTVLIFLKIARMIFTIRDIVATDDFNKKILLTMDLLLSVMSVIQTTTSTVNNNRQLIELNGLLAIVNKKQYYGFETLIDNQTMTCCHLQCYILIFLLFVGVANLSTYAAHQETDSNEISIISKTFVFAVVNYTQTTIFYQYLIEVLLYRKLFNKCFDQIKNSLNQNLNTSDNENVVTSETAPLSETTSLNQPSLEEKLKRLQIFYINLNANYRQLNLIWQLSSLLCWMVIIPTLVLHCYIMVQIYSKVIESDQLLETRSYGTIITVVIYLVIVECTYNVVSFRIRYKVQYVDKYITVVLPQQYINF